MCGGVGLYGRSLGDCVARSAPPIPAIALILTVLALVGARRVTAPNVSGESTIPGLPTRVRTRRSPIGVNHLTGNPAGGITR